MRRPTVAVLACVLGLIWPLCTSSWAGERLSSQEAVNYALEHNPAIAMAEAELNQAMGSWEEASGAFDWNFELNGSFGIETSLLDKAGIKKQVDTRFVPRTLEETFSKLADDIQRQLDSGQFGPLPDCVDTTIHFGTETYEISCPPPGLIIDFTSFLDLADALGEAEIAENLLQAFRRQMEEMLVISRYIAYISRVLLRHYGVISTIEEEVNASLQVSFSKQFRTGITVRPSVLLKANKQNYRGKTLNPAYGGMGKLNRYDAFFGVELDIPLGKGRGRVSAQASELAAKATAEAAAWKLAHKRAEVARDVLIAYWGVVAAQERVRVLERTVELEEELQQIAEALVKAGEIPPSSLAYVQARVEGSRAALREARVALIQAQVGLADVMGMRLENIADVPVASEQLPEPPSPDEMASYAKRASEPLKGRADVVRLRRLEKAAQFLAEAAKADLKRQVDLKLEAWYSGLFEDKRAMSMWHLAAGWGDALGRGFVGPSIRLTVDFSWPFANRKAQGAYEQAKATALEAGITAEDLETKIPTAVADLMGQLVSAAKRVKMLKSSCEANQRTLEAETEKFRHGLSTAVDLVLTEESRVQAELSLIQAKQKVAELLVRLRYELGLLMDEVGHAKSLISERFVTEKR